MNRRGARSYGKPAAAQWMNSKMVNATETCNPGLDREFARVAEILPVIVWSAVPDGTLDYISGDFYLLTGLGDLDLAADAWLEALHPDDRDGTLATWRRVVEAGGDYRMEFRLQTADGGYRWHLAEARPERDEDDRIVRWYGSAVDIHDRTLARLALEQEQQRSGLLLEYSGEGIHGIDTNGRIVFENSRALEMLGYSEGELIGTPAHETIHHHRASGEEYPAQECPIYRTLQDGQTRYTDDEAFFRKDGGLFPVAFTAAAMFAPETGEITGVVVNFRDITSKRRERVLQRLEADVLDRISAGQSLGSILDRITTTVETALPDSLASIMLVDGDRLRDASAPSLPDAYRHAIDGMSIADNVGTCGTAAFRKEAVIAPDVASDARCADFHALLAEHGLAACWSLPVLEADGRILATFTCYHREPKTPTEADLALIHRVKRFVGLAIERVREAERLRASEERFRLVARATSDVVLDWDLIDDKVWWNEGIETQFGYVRDALPEGSESWTQMIRPDDRHRVVGDIEAAIERRDPLWADEYRVICADGRELMVEARGYLVTDKDGRAVRLTGSLVDVTAVRSLERRLQQSQRLEAIGQLTGGIAHDFNNLLTVILGNAELLSEQLDGNQDLYSLAEMTHAAATRGAELTSRLLAFARKQALAPEPADINRLIGGMDPLLHRTLGGYIEIEIVRGGGLWPAQVDPSQLENALLNLALNARDAMPDGGRLTIETVNAKLEDTDAAQSEDVTPGQYVMVAVSDTGRGMDEKTLSRIFEPFFTTKGAGEGSGLGLSMVYGFARQTGGHVHVYSEPGRGTTAKLYLPRAAAGRAANPAPREARARVQSGNETVLVVEDDELVRQHVESSLADLGYEVLTASDGRAALSILEDREDIDLLFTDVVMPGGLSGPELADKARRMRPELPVLFTSGYPENTIVHHGRLDPGVHLLQKPYRREELAAKLRKVIELTEDGPSSSREPR